MTGTALASHVAVCLSVAAGIIGMSLVYDAVVGSNMHELTFGMPLLLGGLWWSGRELARSTLASRAAKNNSLREAHSGADIRAAGADEIERRTIDV